MPEVTKEQIKDLCQNSREIFLALGDSHMSSNANEILLDLLNRSNRLLDYYSKIDEEGLQSCIEDLWVKTADEAIIDITSEKEKYYGHFIHIYYGLTDININYAGDIERVRSTDYHELKNAINKADKYRKRDDITYYDKTGKLQKVKVKLQKQFMPQKSTKIYIFGGNFESCQFGDNNSMQNYLRKIGQLEINNPRAIQLKNELKNLRSRIDKADLEHTYKENMVDFLIKISEELTKPINIQKKDLLHLWISNLSKIGGTVSSLKAAVNNLWELLSK